MIRELHVALGCGVREAVALSDALLRSSESNLSVGRWTALGFDRRTMEQDLRRRLAEALESAPRPRRGRPARRAVAGRQPGG